MKVVSILGAVGSGKSFAAKQFSAPLFNADDEVKKIYNKDKNCFFKLRKVLPKFINSFPIKKKELVNSIISKKKNLNEINKIVHPIVRLKMNKFLYKNKDKKIVVLDIPLLLENKLNKKNYILIFIDAKKKKITENLKKRKNYNSRIIKILEKFQLPIPYKKKKSNFIIKNNFQKKSLKKNVKMIKKQLLDYERNHS